MERFRYTLATFQRIKSSYISHPTGLAVFEEDLYWATPVNYHYDSTISKIVTANIFHANNSHPVEIVSKLNDVTFELHIFHAAMQMQSKKVLSSSVLLDAISRNV